MLAGLNFAPFHVKFGLSRFLKRVRSTRNSSNTEHISRTLRLARAHTYAYELDRLSIMEHNVPACGLTGGVLA